MSVSVHRFIGSLSLCQISLSILHSYKNKILLHFTKAIKIYLDFHNSTPNSNIAGLRPAFILILGRVIKVSYI